MAPGEADRERFHAMDALRAGALLSVVMAHSGFAYLRIPIPDLLWVVHDRSTSLFFDWLSLWPTGVSMPLFFVMSGYFSAAMCQRRGPDGFIRERLRRILVPLVAGGAVILPLTLYVWAWGWLITGRCTVREILRLKFQPGIQRNLWGPAHLWFLEYLFLFALLLWAVQRLLKVSRTSWAKADDRRAPRFLPGLSAWDPVLFSIPTALVLWRDPATLIDFHNSFIPDPLRFLHYAVFFAGGVWLFRCRWNGQRHAPLVWFYLLLTLPALFLIGWLLRRGLSMELSGAARLAAAVTIALFAWCSIFGYCAVAVRALNRYRPAVRYLSDASYWVYLVHFPIVGLAQIALYGVAAPAGLKFTAVAAVALAAGLLSYQSVVRYTFVGTFLHGARRRLEAGSTEELKQPVAATRT